MYLELNHKEVDTLQNRVWSVVMPTLPCGLALLGNLSSLFHMVYLLGQTASARTTMYVLPSTARPLEI